MSATDTELGPIDYLVVEFPGDKQNFTGAMAKELAALIDNNTVRVLDLVIVQKDENGEFEALELDDLDDVGELEAAEATLAEILAAEDLAHIANAMDPGTVAAVLVWENTWASPFATAIRESEGQLVASGRIPTQALIAAFEADAASTEGA
jgi:hypothetical protein